MTVYIKDFRFCKRFGKPKIYFKYYTGYKWKSLTVKNDFNTENVAVYTRYVLDCVIKDLCGKETDVHKRNDILKSFEFDMMCISQLNSSLLTGSTKIFG